MKQWRTLLLSGLCLVSSAAFADAKQTFLTGKINVLEGSSQAFSTIMSKTVTTASQKELLMDLSLECGLLTRTKASSKLGITDVASAEASVMVRVLVDGREASPGKVVFCKRTQELTATMGGILNQCTDANADGTIDGRTECTWDSEEIQLVLNTMAANSFSFALGNLASGSHQVEVQAMLSSGSSATLGEADAKANIGKGSVSIEEVRYNRSDSITF